MDFLRTETLPIVNTLKWFTFGQADCSTNEYNHVYNVYKDNVKVINKHMNGRQFLAGEGVTIADVQFVVS